jgi:hypothetical protein
MPITCALGIALAGCSGPAAQPSGPTTPQPKKEEPLVVTATGVGPLTAQTPATLSGLRAHLVGFDVAPVNRTEGLEYVVSRNGETLFYVIPDPEEDGKILNVHITSAKATVQKRAWTIGKTLAPNEATTCECWGDKPTCFRKGDNVAASFDRTCDEYDPNIRQRIASAPIARIVWSPMGFDGTGGAAQEGENGGMKDPCGWGGNPCGGP